MRRTKSAGAKSKTARPSEPAGFDPGFLTPSELHEADFSREWLVDECLAADEPCVIGGPKKSLKSSIAIDLAVSLGSGNPFLGHFEVPRQCRVALLSGESGRATVQETARRVAAAKGIGLDEECDVLWSFRLPRLDSPADRNALSGWLEHGQVRVVIIDPLYLCLMGTSKAASASNLDEVGPRLRLAARACLRAGATPVLVHHATKASSRPAEGPPDLEDLAFAGDGEFARQWLLLRRREDYRPGSGVHKLLLNVGGSAGHSSLHELEVREGVLGSRRWGVMLRDPDEAAFSRQSIPAKPGPARRK